MDTDPSNPTCLDCQACRLAGYRTQVVPGRGNWELADIAGIGEAPGRSEDEQGKPFVGRAGELLEELLLEADIDPARIFLDNMVKCRPPDNDLRPFPDAIAACPSRWLLPTLDAMKPKVIVAFGATAGSLWFPGKKVHELAKLARVLEDGTVVVGSYHPAAVFRNRSVRESIVESLKRARRVADGR